MTSTAHEDQFLPHPDDVAQAQPKRRPYNASASLSEYGIFPECDAAPAAQAQPDAGLDVEAVLRRFLTGDGFIAECDIQHIVSALTAQPAISGYTCTVPDDCETLHWRGQILSMNELASVAQPAAGEEIMVNAPGDVYTLPMQPSGLTSGPRFVVHVPAQPAASAHPIPQPLRDTFSAIEDSAPSANGMQVFTQMRTAVQSFFQAQPAASEEPSDEEAAKFADQYGMYYDQDTSIAGAHARALLSRYGRPAGDADDLPLAGTPRYKTWLQLRTHGQWPDDIPEWAKDHTGHMNDMTAARAVIEELAAAGVAAQKADDARDAVEVLAAIESGEWDIYKVGTSDGLSDAANAAMAFCAQRIRYPFEGADGASVWFGPSAVAALRKAKAAIAQQRKEE